MEGVGAFGDAAFVRVEAGVLREDWRIDIVRGAGVCAVLLERG